MPDAAAIVPFVRSVQKLFETMLQLPVELGDCCLHDSTQPCHDVSGIITLAGDVNGLMVLNLPGPVAQVLVERFAGEKLEVADPDFADAIGELTNMIAGAAKARLTQPNITISCPSVVVGPGHMLFSKKATPIIKLPAQCAAGEFNVLISLKDDQPQAAATEAAATAGAAG